MTTSRKEALLHFFAGRSKRVIRAGQVSAGKGLFQVAVEAGSDVLEAGDVAVGAVGAPEVVRLVGKRRNSLRMTKRGAREQGEGGLLGDIPCDRY